MHMTTSDLLVLQTAADVLDRHGYDSSDLRSAIDAAEQANDDERTAAGEPYSPRPATAAGAVPPGARDSKTGVERP